MDGEDLIETDLFREPDDFYKEPPKPHFVKYKRKKDTSNNEIELRLVGSSPLWGHMLWNAGIYTAEYLDKHADELVKDRKVLELGAAAALPSLICALNGCEKIVSTDYPDNDLIENIEYNFDHCKGIDRNKAKVTGFLWGSDVTPLFDVQDGQVKEEDKFDLLVLADLVFNHSEHRKLLKTCRESLKRTGLCLVVFTPHRPRLLDRDLDFFKLCEEYGLKAEQKELARWHPMFEEDEETTEIRSRIYCYHLVPTW